MTRVVPLLLCLTLGCDAAATHQAATGDEPISPAAAHSTQRSTREAGGPAARGGAPQLTARAGEFDAARAWQHLEAQVAIGPRVSGTAANRNAALMASEVRPLAETAWRFAEKAGT